jgi:general secretion pathway protein J
MPRRASRLRRAIRAAPCRGFTLLELLVAISILATVSLIAWRGLDTLVHTRARLEPEGEQVRALLTTFGQLDRDTAQAINPTLFALTVSPVTVTLVGGQPALSITRLAPVEADKPTALEVVGYRVEDGYLVRSASLPMRGRGAVAAEEITNVRLLEGVKALRVRIYRDGLGWVDPFAAETAPAPAAPGASPATVAPLVPPGIEVTIERNDGKRYRRVLLVG